MITKLIKILLIFTFVYLNCSLKLEKPIVDENDMNKDIENINSLEEKLLKKYKLQKLNANKRIVLGHFEYNNLYITIKSGTNSYLFDIKKNNHFISKNLSLAELKSKFPNVFTFFNSAVAGNNNIILDASKSVPQKMYPKITK